MMLKDTLCPSSVMVFHRAILRPSDEIWAGSCCPPPSGLNVIVDEYRQVRGSDKEQKGTGLGLPIAKKFAELLGGSIGVESQVGKGSAFTVRVPVVYREG